MEESRRLFERFHSQLNPVDNLYGRLFNLIERYRKKLTDTGKGLSENISNRSRELTTSSRELTDSISIRVNEIGDVMRTQMDPYKESLINGKTLRISPQKPEL